MAAEAPPRHDARAPLRTTLLRSSRPPPLPPASCSAPRVPSLTPFRRPPPVQAPGPGSGCGRSAKETRGREKCFRGNGPRVGVCKLASVPARAAAAAGLARGARGPGEAPRGGGDGGRPRRAGFWSRPRASPREFNWETKTDRLSLLQAIGRSQRPRIFATPVFPLEDTKFFEKTKAVQYGS